MKKVGAIVVLMFFVISCGSWQVAPQPFPVTTPIPTGTPVIITLTPLIIPPPTLIITSTQPPLITETTTATSTTIEPSMTPTTQIIQSVSVDILGCNTSFDIRNGMYEVTNAFVTVKNTGTVDLPNTCAILRAIDEGREHPDKEVCVDNLPVNNQVTLKLTVDSTYREDTFIQVDVNTNETILLRVDKASCRNIDLFGGTPPDVGIIKPTQP